MSDAGPQGDRRRPAVKICGLTRRGDALRAAEAGAEYVGVILAPGSPRRLEPEEAAEVVRGVGATPVVVTVDRAPAATLAAAQTIGAGVLQLHGAESPEEAHRLREGGSWRVWKAFRPEGGGDLLERIRPYLGAVDGILLDGRDPRKGGDGAAFEWAEAADLREALPGPVALIVAGGLGADNVEEAVRRLAPDVVDVSSGVESSPGVKDSGRIAAFVRAAHRGRPVRREAGR